MMNRMEHTHNRWAVLKVDDFTAQNNISQRQKAFKDESFIGSYQIPCMEGRNQMQPFYFYIKPGLTINLWQWCSMINDYPSIWMHNKRLLILLYSESQVAGRRTNSNVFRNI